MQITQRSKALCAVRGSCSPDANLFEGGAIDGGRIFEFGRGGGGTGCIEEVVARGMEEIIIIG